MIESIRFAIGFEMRSHLVIATVASVLAVLTASGAQAQQGSVSNSRLMFDPNSVGTPTSQPQKLTPPATTTGQTAQQPAATRQTIAPQQQSTPPAPAARSANTTSAKPAPAKRAAPTERVMNDATVAAQSRTARPIPREELNLGRVTLPQQGSLGYESKTQLQSYDLSDGRGRVPGYDNISRNDSSYFGLSLRMPTLNAPSPSSSSSPSYGSSPSTFGGHGAN